MLPSLNDAAEAGDAVRTRARRAVLSWLPTAFECPECAVPCRMGRRWDRQTAAFHAEHNGEAPAWICPECDRAFRREEEGWGVNPWG